MFHNTYMDSDEPNRETLRSETVEPKARKSTRETLLPSRATPYSETAEPNLQRELRRAEWKEVRLQRPV